MTELEAVVIMDKGDKKALFNWKGTRLALPILNEEGCRVKDLIMIHYNGRDPFVRRTTSNT